VGDMIRWIAFMADSGRVDGTPLLKPATWAELLAPQTMVPAAEFYPTTAITRPQWMTYGLGWFQHDYTGRRLNFHTGSIDGMVAIAAVIPEDRFGVYVLANLDHVEVRHALMYKAIDTWLGTGTRDWSAELKPIYDARRARADSAQRAVERARVPNTRPTLPLERYAGSYADSLVGSVRVSVENGMLRLTTSSKLFANLSHWQYDTFLGEWNRRWQGPFLVTFGLNATGTPERLEYEGATLRRVAP
jgi:hypothetical protein